MRGAARIVLQVGRVIGKHEMAKHFDLRISDTTFSSSRRSENIAREATIADLYNARALRRANLHLWPTVLALFCRFRIEGFPNESANFYEEFFSCAPNRRRQKNFIYGVDKLAHQIFQDLQRCNFGKELRNCFFDFSSSSRSC